MKPQEHNIGVMRQLTFDLDKLANDGLNEIIDHGGIHDALLTLKNVVCQRFAGCPSPALIYGKAGSGKSTLLRSLMVSARKSVSDPDSKIILIQPEQDSGRFPALEAMDRLENDAFSEIKLFAIDDVHKITGDDAHCFWNLFNRLTRGVATLVMTSRLHPSEMFEGNEHLRSRLLAGLVISIAPPDDLERMRILDQMARSRGFTLAPEVQRYILRRKSRNLKELDLMVKLMDKLSIETRRRVTIPLVKELEQQGLI